MQTLLGLLCLSVFFSAVFSHEHGHEHECEKCPLAETCTPKKGHCPDNVDGCFTLQLEKEGTVRTIKDCMPKKVCSELKGEVGKVIPKDKYGSFPDGSIVIDVKCSKAPSSSASVLLALSGFLVMKFLL